MGMSLFADVPDDRQAYWVFFYDKGVTSPEDFDPAEHDFPHLSQRALDRRALRGTITGPTYRDLDVPQEYIDEILSPEVEVRAVSRWFNAVSLLATAEYIDGLSANPVVKRTKRIHKVSKKMIRSASREAELLTNAEYGESYGQNLQINAVEAHSLGITGSDVWLLMLDTGYFTDHLAFQPERIVAEYDFIQGDSTTQNQDGDAASQHNHGTATASAAGGFIDGELRGVAYECKFLLAKTEIVDQEIIAEEDQYIEALEWGEARGADVASSSLGYLDWYTYADMDGETAITTRGVDYATSLGLVCVTAMGNEGNGDWFYMIAPADADSVIAVGAVDSLGNIASFSSHGPTYDGRIKPEVVARGVATFAAGTANSNAFIAANGTSLSTPLVAGASALLLQAHPDWTPMMVREALMMTANNATSPNNSTGFGLIDVMAALAYNFGVIPGDINVDEVLNVSDAVLLLEWVLNNTEITEIEFALADVNDDNRVDILDIVVLVEWILTL
jgi:serine protease AprX